MKFLSDSKKSFHILRKELLSHNPVIIPTDTNYNLCCFADDDKAIDKIFLYKNRKKDKPLSLFIFNKEDWVNYGEVKDNLIMKKLTSEFWPGPLNIIVKNKTNYNYMLNNSDSIAIGCIKNSTHRNFLEYLDSPLAITSANISGQADNLLVDEKIAAAHMDEKVNYLLKSSQKGLSTMSSTIISLVNDEIELIREGDIKFSDILKACDEIYE